MITLSALNLVIAVCTIFGVVFAVFFYFKNPQIKTDQTTANLQDQIHEMKKEIVEIKETHLRGMENDIKNLTASIAQLDKTVVRLTTIIDERIPRTPGSLTPSSA